MATTLRDLSDKAKDNIQFFKNSTGIKTDNKAIVRMLEEHIKITTLERDLYSLQYKYKQLLDTLKELHPKIQFLDIKIKNFFDD